jgi:hypothetical protein
MSKEEFMNTGFYPGIKIIIIETNVEYLIESIDFEEGTFFYRESSIDKLQEIHYSKVKLK